MLVILFEYFFHQPYLPGFYLQTLLLLFVEFLNIIKLCVATKFLVYTTCGGNKLSQEYIIDEYATRILPCITSFCQNDVVERHTSAW